MRAIDLYSGVGGWSLGLRLAGIEVVASYEICELANVTNLRNNRHQTNTVDIRQLKLEDLPKKIDVVVGSPPCTQFSFSNRGGNGDLSDGLKDIIKFLTIVDFLKPKFWAMENVPRVAKIIEDEMRPGGVLRRFRHLGMKAQILKLERFGLPQRRTRCLVGNLDFQLLESYVDRIAKHKTLGGIVKSLNANNVIDPLYGVALKRDQLSDHILEDYLNEEEIRINQASKVLHPIYNAMPFPDPLRRSVRTITATCTRVSRESVIIASPNGNGQLRRLTIRERASLQGFPISFQFYAERYAQKVRMIGNAIPPAFTYFVGLAFRGVSPKRVKPLSSFARALKLNTAVAKSAVPERPGARYPFNRTFRFAIPSLRLKSGVRFELANSFNNKAVRWRIDFYFGSSTEIHRVILNQELYSRIMRCLPPRLRKEVAVEVSDIRNLIVEADILRMQLLWSHRGLGGTRPLMLLDQLSESGAKLSSLIDRYRTDAESVVTKIIGGQFDSPADIVGIRKLERNAPIILAGLILGSLANAELILRDGASSKVRKTELRKSNPRAKRSA